MGDETYSILGVPFRLLGISDSELEEQIAPLLDGFSKGNTPGVAFELNFEFLGLDRWRVSNGEGCADFVFGESFPRFDDFITLWVIKNRPDLWFLHASSVAISGRVSTFVGPSTSGKSTLATALAQSGAKLLSDDITPFNPATGEVIPFCGKPRLRPYSESRLAGRGPLDVAPGSARYTLCNIFVLNPSPATDSQEPEPFEYVDISSARIAWDRMLRFCLGKKSSAHFGDSNGMMVRSPRSFFREPKLHPLRNVLAARQVLRHLVVQPQPFMELLRQLDSLSAFINTYGLDIGHLESTVRLIQGTLGITERELAR